MLNTIKQLKGVLNFNISFSWIEASWSTFDSSLISLKWEDFIKQNKDEIIKWIESKKWNDNNIWFSDFWNNESETAKWWTDLVHLCNLLWVVPSNWNWYPISSILDKLNSFSVERNTLWKETRQQLANLESSTKDFNNIKVSDSISNHSLVSTFNENRFSKLTWNKPDSEVRKLQIELNKNFNAWLKVDWRYWKNTRDALRAARWWSKNLSSDSTQNLGFRDSSRKEVVSSQYSWNETPLFWDSASFDDASKQIDRTWTSLTDLEAKFRLTAELNGKLSSYLFREKAWYSIESLVRRLFGEDKTSKILGDKERYLSSMTANREKIESAVNFLRDPYDRNVNDNWERTDRYFTKQTVDNILKAAPWLLGIYLWDIPLPFIKEMVPWVDLNKTMYFEKWLQDWMPWSFEKYYNSNKNESLNPLKEQITLIDVLSRTNLTKREQANILSWNLSWLDQKTENLLLSYLEHNLIPNLEILSRESFNAFERWEWYTIWWFFGLARDGKHTELDKIIVWLKEAVLKRDLNNSSAVNEAFRLLSEEWDISRTILNKAENSNDYMQNISWNNKTIQDRFKPILDLWDEKIFNDYNRLFALEKISDVFNLWLVEEDKAAVQELFTIIWGWSINKDLLLNWQKENPRAYNFIKSLWNSSEMQKYLISSIPKVRWLHSFGKYERWAHWPKLEWLNNYEDLRIATTTSPEPSKWISTLWLAYKSFVEKAWITWISYNEFEEAFGNKTRVELSSMADEKVINTNRNTWRWKLTSFSELAKQRWDTHALKLNIDKQYTYYEGGQLVQVKVDYSLYLRPDCTNPLIVPKTINVVKNWQAVPESDFLSLTQVSGRLPVVIPWNLIISWWSPVSESWVSTKPWHIDTGNVTWNIWWSTWTSNIVWWWTL